ncbi:MAG: ABC transporter ATP-binding protein, partial [Firmicutes bacterium]|nr:ABC transporter ATP-binding protein [Bacillota bacterium]
HENDIDYQVACDLASEVFFDKRFELIGEGVYQSALQRLKSCDTVINCLKSYGEMNERNKELYEKAVSQGLKIVESAEAL